MAFADSLVGDTSAAADAAEERAGELITGISQRTMKAIRNLVVQAIEDGETPADLADSIEGLIGLTDPQAQAARSYREELVDSGLSVDRVEAEYEKYTDGQLAQRADAIARTEVMGALNEGVLDDATAAQADGDLGAGATKFPMAAEGCCDVCADLDGQEIPLDEDFDADGEELSAPPFHTCCKCGLGINPGKG